MRLNACNRSAAITASAEPIQWSQIVACPRDENRHLLPGWNTPNLDVMKHTATEKEVNTINFGQDLDRSIPRHNIFL